VTSRLNVSAWIRTRVRAQAGQDLGGLGEQEIPGEDGDRVVPPGVDRRAAAAHQGLVHDVVVEQRGQVGQLDRDRRLDDPRVLRVAEPRGQQHEHGPEALAAGRDGMPGRLGQQFVVGMRRRGQQLLDPAQVVEHLRLEGGVREVNGNCADQLLST